MYNKFAYYYDVMMENVNYDYFIDIVTKYIPPKGVILDAGCGTGAILIGMLQNNYNVIGVDLSSEMLEICEHKLRSNNLCAKLYQGDLTQGLAIESFDAVVSFLDVINYIKDYKSAFENIYASLKSGGIFIFDVHSVFYVNDLIGYEEEMNYQTFQYHWNVTKGDEENSIIHHLIITTKENNVYEEKHFQRTYPLEVYIKTLEEIGFKVEVLPESDEYKTFIKCQK